MKRWWSVLLVGFILAAPLVATGAWLFWNDRWAPIFDLAMTEVRVRDVGTSHTPLVGLPGRLGRIAPGSHPGPLSFYLLSPIYRLLGGSYWALRVSTLALNALAIVSTLAIVRRRAGAAGVIGAGLVLGLLELGYGLLVLSEPWNPHLPVLWFPVFLVSIWSALSGDLPMLVVAVASGTFCAQTHIPYLAICGGIGALAVSFLAVSLWQDRRRGALPPTAGRSLAIALGTLILLWIPVLLDQWTSKPGNLAILLDYFRRPPEASVGVRAAAKLVLGRLDAWHFVAHTLAKSGVLADAMQAGFALPVRGGVLLLAWLAGAVVSKKLANRTLLALHAVVGGALVVQVVAFSRIVGVSWEYLLFSAWGTSALVLFATASSLGLALRQRWPDLLQRRYAPLAGVGIAAIAAIALRLALGASRSGSSTPNPSAQLAALAPGVGEALRKEKTGPYLVTWSDALYGGGQGLGLVNELERRGISSGVTKEYGSLLGEHRVVDPGRATLGIHFANAGWIPDLRKAPGARQIAYHDPRTNEGKEELRRLRATVRRALAALGRSDAIANFDRDRSSANVPGLDLWTGLTVLRINDLGVPAAVFVLPVANR